MSANGSLFFWAVTSILLFMNIHASLARKEILDCDSDKILFNSTRHDKRIPEFVDFKGRVIEMLGAFLRSHGLQLEWYDIDGSKAKAITEEYDLKNPEHYKVLASSSKTTYGSGIRCRRHFSEEEDTINICNHSKKPISYMVPARDIVIRNEATWTDDEDFKKMDIDFDMPDDFETGEENVYTSRDSGGSRSKVNTQVFTYQSNVTVDPGKELVLRFVTIKEEVELPYVSELSLTGNISAKYNQEFNGSDFGSFPITYFADRRFRKRDGGLVFNCSGIFRGARGITTHVYYIEWPMKKSKKCKIMLKPREHSDDEHSGGDGDESDEQ